MFITKINCFFFELDVRDFANGYLIAEIFSRYFPSDLYVSTFYNGTSSAQKLNNWVSLKWFFYVVDFGEFVNECCY